jgi:hypothetical protein
MEIEIDLQITDDKARKTRANEWLSLWGTITTLAIYMGGGKGKKDVNAKLTTNFINILKYKTNHL